MKSDQSRFENIEVRINNYSDRIKELEKDVAIIKTRLNGK